MTLPDFPPIEIDELVVNWHINEACNYRCRYCFAKWHSPEDSEVWRDRPATTRLLEGLRDFFDPATRTNPLLQRMRWRSVRLSLAGGEPTLLGNRLVEIARQARDLGFEVSLITNGSRLDAPILEALAPVISMLGLSVDSIVSATNAVIGRASRGTVLALNDIVAIVERARTANSALSVKINTVVNAANAEEDLSPLIGRVRPERWKVMRMLPVVTDDLAVEPSVFAAFVARHSAFSAVMRLEDNDEMTQSYVMVDPHGHFFQNASGGGPYIYSNPIIEAGPAVAFTQIPFVPLKFAARYDTTDVPREGP